MWNQNHMKLKNLVLIWGLLIVCCTLGFSGLIYSTPFIAGENKIHDWNVGLVIYNTVWLILFLPAMVKVSRRLEARLDLPSDIQGLPEASNG